MSEYSAWMSDIRFPSVCAFLLIFHAVDLWAGQSCDDPAAEIQSITFSGNNVTKPQTLLRELSIRPGHKLDLSALESSRQAIQDLGLFRAVTVDCNSGSDGIHVQFVVREKYYVIPAPRFDANSDGQTAWGAQVRWDNVAGLNHHMVIKALRRQDKEVGRGASNDIDVRYFVPYLGDTPWGVSMKAAYVEQDVEDDTNARYLETRQSASFSLVRDLDFQQGPASRGLSLSVGLGWVDTVFSEGATQPDPGQSLQLPWALHFNNRRDHIYSHTGHQAQLFGHVSSARLVSDYSEVALNLKLKSAWNMGETPHQTLDFTLHIGNRSAGPADGQFEYAVGGSKSVRAYALNTQRGDGQVWASVDAYRPVFRPWLRIGPFVEAGRAWHGPEDNPEQWMLGAGLGFQLRLTWFVNAVLNFGYALPLNGGNGGRFYARGG